MGNAQQNINSCMSAMQNVVTSLQQAMESAEKPQNKQIIESAIKSVNNVCNDLCKFKD